MRKIFLIFLLLFSCTTKKEGSFAQWMKKSEKIKVLSTIAILDDIVSEIGGDKVEHIPLIQGNMDPHSYQLVKGDDEKMGVADVIFSMGLGLEHGPSLRYQLEMSKKSYPVGDEILRQFPSDILRLNGQIDPHIWMDLSLFKKAIPFMVEALSQADPKNQEIYQNRGEALVKKMENLDIQFFNQLQAIEASKRFLVTSHDAFNYFAKRYLALPEEIEDGSFKKRFQAPEGLAPESQLSTVNIQEIIDHLEKYNIQVIFPESNVSKDSLRKIVAAAQEKGIDVQIADVVLYADAMGEKGSSADTYLKMMEYNVNEIKRRL